MRVLTAKVARVHGIDGFDADLYLGFDITLRKEVRFHGPIYPADIDIRKRINHCLVILIGGKVVTLVTHKEAAVVTADVYLTLGATDFPKTGLPGVGGDFVSLTTALHYLSSSGYDPAIARSNCG